MNVQPKLCQHRMLTAPRIPASAGPGETDPAAPTTVLGATDGEVLVLGEVP